MNKLYEILFLLIPAIIVFFVAVIKMTAPTKMVDHILLIWREGKSGYRRI